MKKALSANRFSLSVIFILVSFVGFTIFDVPILRQIAGFIFLTFVPGALVLRTLKIHNIGAVERLVYSVGLSLAVVMFGGIAANTILPLFGISRPISFYPLMITFGVIVLVLSAIAYRRNRAENSPGRYNITSVLSPPVLFVILLLIIAVMGALLVSHNQNNILLLTVIFAIALVVGFAAFGKFIPEAVYPLALVMIALALLYHTNLTLASPFLSGYDVMAEMRYQNLVTQNGLWNPAIWGSVNTSLSIVMLCPVYSILLGMDAVWVFKIIYPLFYSLVPLVLFQIFRDQIGGKRAFFSVFFFISVLYFAGVGNRLQVAELFFGLLILLMLDRRMTPGQKSFLAVIFAVSLPVSHYGLAYICIFIFLLGWLTLLLFNSDVLIALWTKLAARFRQLPNGRDAYESRAPNPVLNMNLIVLYIVFTLAWYIYVSSGSPFHALVNIGHHIYTSLNEFFNPLARESLVATAAGLDFPMVSALGRIFRIFQYVTQFLIVIGFIRMVFRPWGLKFRKEYVALSMVGAFMLFLFIVVPYLSGKLEVNRIYHIVLIILSPLCIIGGEVIWGVIAGLCHFAFKRRGFNQAVLSPYNNGKSAAYCFRFLALGVLIPYFLFTTGFIFEVTKSELYNVVDTPSSEALSGYRMDMKTMNSREHNAMDWLSGMADEKVWIYTDQYGYLQRNLPLYSNRIRQFPGEAELVREIPENSYVYLRTWNIARSEAVFMYVGGQRIKFGHISFKDFPELSGIINNKNLIYNNGGAQVLESATRSVN